MKIYQIHETGGEYEDYFDYIVGTYLYQDKAELEMQRLIDAEEIRQKQYKKCQECPINDFDIIADNPFDVIRKACQKYCSHSEVVEDIEYDEFFCENQASYWDDKNYELKEVEVIE